VEGVCMCPPQLSWRSFFSSPSPFVCHLFCCCCFDVTVKRAGHTACVSIA
jgi:hypothetical protein